MELEKLVTGVQHIGIPTDNLEKTIQFYTGLGFQVAYRTVNNGEPVAFLRFKNLTVETYENHCASNRPGAIDHVALDVTDIDAVFKALHSGEYEFLDSEVQSLPFWEHGVRFFTILGPNSEKIEFSQMM